MIGLFLSTPGKDSVMGRIDPLVKLFFTFVYAILVVVVKGFIPYLILGVGLLPLLFLSGSGFMHYLKRLWGFSFLFLFTLLFHLFLTPGKVLFHVWIFRGTLEGLLNGVLFSVRLLLLILSAAILNLTTQPFDMAERLNILFRRVPFTGVREFPFLLSLSMRFVPQVFYEGRRIVYAQRARGVNMPWAKRIFSLLFPLVYSSLRKAETLGFALNAKGFVPGKIPSPVYRRRFLPGDILLSIYTIALLTLIILI